MEFLIQVSRIRLASSSLEKDGVDSRADVEEGLGGESDAARAMCGMND
jgi:hypothetical protein